MDVIPALRRVLFLKNLSDSALLAVAGAGYRRLMGKGKLLFAAHEKCIGLIVVLEGAVRVYQVDERGRELTLSRDVPGECVIELPLFDGGNYPVSAEAVEDGTCVLIVPRGRFLELMNEYSEIAVHGARALAIRIRRLLSMLEAQTLHTVQARLAAYLIRASDGRTEFSLSETNEAIGSAIGTVREVVSRSLRSLQEQGAIDLRGRHVAILDEAQLQRLAGSMP